MAVVTALGFQFSIGQTLPAVVQLLLIIGTVATLPTLVRLQLSVGD